MKYGLAHRVQIIVESHPTGVRGLKSDRRVVRKRGNPVAPHWGAWIEMDCFRKWLRAGLVAPHWGAWIEIVRCGLST